MSKLTVSRTPSEARIDMLRHFGQISEDDYYGFKYHEYLNNLSRAIRLSQELNISNNSIKFHIKTYLKLFRA